MEGGEGRQNGSQDRAVTMSYYCNSNKGINIRILYIEKKKKKEQQ